MKNFIKKLTAASLSFILIAAVFTACGSPDDNEITRSPDKEIVKPPLAVTPAPPTSPQQPSALPPETSAQTPFNLDDLIGPEDLPSLPTSPAVTAPVDSNPSKRSSGGLNLNPAALAEKLGKFTNDMGFEYDTKQGIFYSSRDSWQRDANYFNHYDWAANYADMRYQTVYMEFSSPDDPYTTGTYGDPIDWRIQFWKGQYGFLGGTELGIYTKRPDENEKVYACADDDHMMNIYYEIYKTKEDYENGRLYFYRDEWNGVGHWWVTGFKLDSVDPPRMVMKGKLHLKTNKLAAMLLEQMRIKGFTVADSPAELTLDTCCRDDRDIHFVWQGVGSTNYE